jgi:hypothetical protein
VWACGRVAFLEQPKGVILKPKSQQAKRSWEQDPTRRPADPPTRRPADPFFPPADAFHFSRKTLMAVKKSIAR